MSQNRTNYMHFKDKEIEQLWKKIFRQASFNTDKLSKHYEDLEGVDREVVVVGRSNAGKSSFLATIMDNKKLVKTSKTPGQTQQMNYFDLTQDCFLVDSPGYGYSKMDRSTARQVAETLTRYLSKKQGLMGLVYIWDIRRDPGQEEKDLLGILSSHVPVIVVATKSDKLNTSEKSKRMNQLQNGWAEVLNHASPEIFMFSSLKKQGISPIISSISNWLGFTEKPEQPANPEQSSDEQGEL